MSVQEVTNFLNNTEETDFEKWKELQKNPKEPQPTKPQPSQMA